VPVPKDRGREAGQAGVRCPSPGIAGGGLAAERGGQVVGVGCQQSRIGMAQLLPGLRSDPAGELVRRARVWRHGNCPNQSPEPWNRSPVREQLAWRSPADGTRRLCLESGSWQHGTCWPVPHADRYPGVPSRWLLRARRWSCRSCTPGSQSQPNVADGPTRGSLGTPVSRKACTYARSWSIRACT